jgi:crotonobetainyl-CoA:carnitine CoA-transferase CaiB-like acyl-CoA transferase
MRMHLRDLPTGGDLIHARLTPFGDDGPWADFKSSDLVSLALGGVTMNCGYDPQPGNYYDLPPMTPQLWHSFHIAGEQLVIGIVGALIRRHHTGRGQKVSVSIHEAVSKNTELDVTSWIMLRQEVYRQTCRHASAEITDPSIVYTKDGRWLLAMSLGKRDLNNLAPFMARFGIGGLTGQNADEAELVRPIGGSTAAATSQTEIVQRLSRRFTYDNLPWREAQEAGLLWAPVRKPHENSADEHWLSRGTFEDVKHPELDRSFRYPISKWISTAGSWRAGRRAPRLGEDSSAVLGAPTALRAHAQPRRAEELTDVASALGKPFPLQGVRILDFTWFLASAGSTRFLASLGADVLKIEWKTHPDSGRGFMVPEGGREARDRATGPLKSVRDPSIGGQFNNKNPGKRGLSLNVADPRGLEIAKALVPQCDVVAEGFSPGVLERWGLSYEVLRSLRSDIIYVKQSGMGAFGKYGRFRCLGPIAAALAGVSEMSGLPEPAPPAGWGYSYLDWFGAYSMALSVLTALYHRDRTGEGQWIDASQTEVGIFLTAVPVLDWSANGRTWKRVGNRSAYKPAAPHGIYRCAGEDRWIAITCFSDEEWRALADVAARPDWLADSRFGGLAARIANQDALDECVQGWTREQDPYVLMDRLQRAGVPAGVCQNAADRYERDPQLRHLDWLTELDSTRLGRWPVAATSIHMSETPPYTGGLTNRGAPLYGEDNASILSELLGMSESEIEALTRDGVL